MEQRVTSMRRPTRSSPALAWWVTGLFLAFLAGVGVGYWIWGQAPGAVQAASPEGTAVPSEPTRYQVSVDDDPALGSADAPVVIIEFSDYQCPYCRRFRLEVFDRLREAYGDKIYFVYRDFPLMQIHPEAVPAAIAANCAGEQGAYWDFHDKLFEQTQGLSKEAYLAYAEELGLDMAAFTACIEEERYKDEVLADFRDGQRLGVTGTPTFFINGLPLVGAQPFEVFQQMIESELAGGN